MGIRDPVFLTRRWERALVAGFLVFGFGSVFSHTGNTFYIALVGGKKKV